MSEFDLNVLNYLSVSQQELIQEHCADATLIKLSDQVWPSELARSTAMGIFRTVLYLFDFQRAHTVLEFKLFKS